MRPTIRHWLRRLAGLPLHLARAVGYRLARALGRSAGDFTFRGVESGFPDTWNVALCLSTGMADPAAARRWCAARQLPELVLARSGESRWLYAPGELPTIDATHLHGAVLVAAAEAVDAVLLAPHGEASDTIDSLEAHDLLAPEWRRFTLFRADTFEYSAEGDRVLPRRERWLAKLVSPNGTVVVPGRYPQDGTRRRGPYRSTYAMPPRLEVGIRDAGRLPRIARPADPRRPALLVTTPFLARGGAEQTLYETLRLLVDRFEITVVTLAPHRPELDDRREDFRRLGIPIFSLGDWVHPAAMVGMLCSLVESLAPVALYNANGTTLFYDFLPRLKAQRPTMRIIDHLYDHRVGYIERYDGSLLGLVDACVAENHPIAETLAERGWPPERAPVIWPCGRGTDAFPPREQWQARRDALRRELEIDEETVLFLTAARIHPQKRPLDLVRLAERLLGSRAFFLLVGGGELEAEVDAAIDETRARHAELPIRRLGFRDDIPELMLAADVGCLVSEFEGLPVFLLECLQAGRPFLGTEVGDLGRVLQQTSAGLVSGPPGELDALEAAVRQLLDDATRSRYAERARLAGPSFGPGPCAERYAAVFLGREVDEA